MPSKKQQAPQELDSSFLHVAQQIYTLRKAEEKGGAITKRTELLLSLLVPSNNGEKSFIQTYAEKGIAVQVFPDANGLKLDIGPDGTQGVHAHIPYEFLSIKTIVHLLETSVISQSAAQEMSVRIAEAHADEETIRTLSQKQRDSVLKKIQQEKGELSGITLADYIREEPDTLSTICVEKGVHLPKEDIRLAVQEKDTQAQSIGSLLSIASALNGGYQGNDGDRFFFAQNPEELTVLAGSGDVQRFSKSVYKHRSEHLHTNPHNYEVSKILSILFEVHGYESLRQQGIQTIRGAYKDGVEFVGFFTGTQYEHILIDPSKHIRTQEAQKNYKSIPLVPNSDFESFEGFLLPYLQFQTLERELNRILSSPERLIDTPAHVSSVLSYIQQTLSILASHMSPSMYEPFLLAGKELLQALKLVPIDTKIVQSFLARLDDIEKEYGGRFQNTSIPEMLELYLKIPERVEVTFDTDFIEGIEKESARERARAFLDSLPMRPYATLVKSATESSIPSVLAGRALRALKITARPTLLLVVGAKFADVDSQSAVDAIAASVIQAGIKSGAHIVMQGGQAGNIVETVVRAYWEYRANLPEGEEPFRIIGIEPGQSTYAGSAGYPQREQAETHPMLPIDSIHTPYAAGWSPGLEDVWEHTYLPHLVYRQELIRFMSEGNPTATLIVNGGSWSVPESVESIKDNFTQIVVPETGRLASMLGHLKDSYHEWSGKGVEGALAHLTQFISQQPEDKRARLENDLALMKKRGLHELIQHIHSPESITTTDIPHLEEALLEALAPKGSV